MPSNIIFYYPNSPQILTDDIFVAHGGETGTSTAAQRQVSYLTSEVLVSSWINTFFSPTSVTGTFVLHPVHPVQTDFQYVNSIDSVTIYSRDRNSSCTMSSQSSCAYLRDAIHGILDINLRGNCGCSTVAFDPYQIEIAYTAGLTSGTVYNSTILTALSLVAMDELEELQGISSTPGGVGIVEWENQEYREKRMPMKETSFGSTPRAQRAVRLLTPFRRFKYAGL